MGSWFLGRINLRRLEMNDIEVALLAISSLTWLFSRQIILKYRPIPKWIDIPIVIVFVILTFYAAYDTFMG